jgi:hypothetical protein
LATQTFACSGRGHAGGQILGVALDDIAHDDIGLGPAQEERDQHPIQARQTIVAHRGSAPVMASSFGSKPLDIVRMTSTDRLSSTAPAGSR